MKFIKFRTTDSRELYINKEYIVAVTTKDGDTVVYTSDGPIPFHVKGTVSEVLEEIELG